MKKRNMRGRHVFANILHRKLFFLVFFAAIIPAFMTAVVLYYLIFYITADQAGIPETIAYTIIPAAQRVVVVLLVMTPVVVVGILVFAYIVTQKLLKNVMVLFSIKKIL